MRKSNTTMKNDTRVWRKGLEALFAICGLVLIAWGAAGCDGASSDSFGTTPENSSGPILTGTEFVDLDGNGVDAGDVFVAQFDSAVTITSQGTSALDFETVGDTFGTGAVLTQTVPGSDKVEIILGTSPNFVPGVSDINVRSSGAINIEDSSGDDVRPAAAAVAITDVTANTPTLGSSQYNDVDGDGTVNEGDTILCEFDLPIAIPGGQTVAGNFTPPVASDTFGTTPTLGAFSTSAANRGVLIVLGDSPTLTITGTFDALVTTAGSPSGVEMTGAPGITDATSTPSTVTASTNADVALQDSALFRSGQSGSLFVGTIDSTTADVNERGFFRPRGAFHIEGTVTVGGTMFAGVDYFFVADTDNHRVLVFNGLPTGNNASAFAVLGQSNLTDSLPNRSAATSPASSASTLWSPTDVHYASDTNQLFVCDSGNHRVLIFDNVLSATTGLYDLADGASADIVVGQSDFNDNSANQGNTTPDSRSLSTPMGLSVAGGQLAVADTENNRVLVWTSIPTSDNAAASVVLGQSSFSVGLVNGGGTATASTLNGPEDVFIDPTLDINGNATDGGVVVADTDNHRVLFYITPTPASGDAADAVLGQADFVSVSSNRGGAVAGNTLDAPSGLAVRDNEVWVADANNHRVVYYDATAVTDGEAGAAFIGQASGVVNDENRGTAPTANTLSFPRGLHISNSATPHFFIADSENHRVLDFSSVPTTSTTADLEQGQPSFSTSDAKGHRYNNAFDVAVTAGRMIVADRDNNRVLIYSSTPTAGDPDPDFVVGQGNQFSTLENQGGTAAAADTLSAPEGVATDGTRLVVADTGNNRVLIYNLIPTADGTSADVVLGQSTMAGSTANSGGISGATLDSPTGVTISGGRLIVSDRDNHRVLIWDDITTVTDGAMADVVIGQQDMVSGTANQGVTLTASTLDSPEGVLVLSSGLFVVDCGNSRVLGYGTVPTSNHPSAVYVIGQGNFVTGSAAAGSGRLTNPTRCASDGTRFMIADTGNHRVAVYNVIPIGVGFALSDALGQTGSAGKLENQGADEPSATTLASPRGMFFDGIDLWVIDSGNSRMIRYR